MNITDEFPKDEKYEKDEIAIEEEEEEDGEIYEVEKILNCFTDENGDIFYLVKWLGYDDEKDLTWEPFDNLKNCQQLIQEYHESESVKKENKSIKKKESKRERKQQKESEIQQILDQNSIYISDVSNFKNLNELKYHQLQSENTILLKDNSSNIHETSKLDSLWFVQNHNYEPKKKIFINRIFNDNGNLLVELLDDENNTASYNYSLISALFPQTLLEYIESNHI